MQISVISALVVKVLLTELKWKEYVEVICNLDIHQTTMVIKYLVNCIDINIRISDLHS